LVEFVKQSTEPRAVLRLFEDLLAAQNRKDAFKALCTCAGEMGFEHLMFLSKTDGVDWWNSLTETSYPEDYMPIYLTHDRVNKDPVRKYGVLTPHSFWWDELKPRLSPQEREMFDVAAEFGLVEGLAIPLFDHAGLCGGMSMVSRNPNRQGPQLQQTLNLITHLYHSTFLSLVAQEAPPKDSSSTSLTAREIEFLKWAAQGSENWQIAEILHLSVKTVEAGFRTIFRKLDVGNRVSAVIAAIRLGYFCP